MSPNKTNEAEDLTADQPVEGGVKSPSKTVTTNLGDILAAQLPNLEPTETTPEKAKKPTMREKLAARDAAAEEARTRLRAVSDIPEPVENAETEEISFENLLESAKTVDDKKLLEEMSKQYSGKKLIVRKPVQGAGWEAQPRKEGEGPLTVEQSQQLCDELNASLKRLTPEKAEQPKEGPVNFNDIPKNIDILDELEDFARKCKELGKVNGSGDAKGWKVEPIENDEESVILSKNIMDRKEELVEKILQERHLQGHLKKINGAKSKNDLRGHLNTLKHFKYIKIGKMGEPIADPNTHGSKEVVNALNEKKKALIHEEVINRYGKKK